MRAFKNDEKIYPPPVTKCLSREESVLSLLRTYSYVRAALSPKERLIAWDNC